MGYSQQQRMQVVREWKRSGLKAADFARQRGIKRQALHNWSWQLNCAKMKRNASVPTGVRLLPVHVTPSVELSNATDRPKRVSRLSLEVMLDGRIRLDFDSDADLRSLSALITILRVAGC